MVISTKMYKGFQTVVPSEIRSKLHVDNSDIIDWNLDENNNTVIVSFRKKSKLHDLSGKGKINKVTNAVDLKHKSQKGVL